MPTTFPVRYESFHDDLGLNFQMNRWMTWIGERAADDLHRVASRIRDYDDWKREMLALADEKVHAGASLDAAYYVRAAEFFMLPGDPDKRAAYDRFLELIHRHYGDLAAHRHEVPYETGALPAYRFPATRPKGVVIIFGGFDSFIEEFLPVVFAVRDAGYELIAFEGPGQGAALVRYGLPMTPCWERPVTAVLDHFALTEVTLIGVSLGGCLVVRAPSSRGSSASWRTMSSSTFSTPRCTRGRAPCGQWPGPCLPCERDRCSMSSSIGWPRVTCSSGGPSRKACMCWVSRARIGSCGGRGRSGPGTFLSA